MSYVSPDAASLRLAQVKRRPLGGRAEHNQCSYRGHRMRDYSFASVTLKTAVIHTVTYFIMGLLAFTFLDYASRFDDPAVASFMRQTNDPYPPQEHLPGPGG